jgi:hypothetical protein
MKHLMLAFAFAAALPAVGQGIFDPPAPGPMEFDCRHIPVCTYIAVPGGQSCDAEDATTGNRLTAHRGNWCRAEEAIAGEICEAGGAPSDYTLSCRNGN